MQPVWKGFQAQNQHYLFHVPTSSLLQISAKLWQSWEASVHDGQITPATLQKLDRDLCPSHTSVGTPLKIDIKSIALNVIERCNLRCTYCYAGEGNYGHDSVMTLQTAKKAIDFFVNQQEQLHLVFFGGEPLLNFKLIQDVVEWCSLRTDKRFTYSLTTNATLLTEDHLAFFKRHGFSLKISYDGLLQSQQRPTSQTRDNSPMSARVAKKLGEFNHSLQSLRTFYLRSTVSRQHIPEFFISLFNTMNSFSYQMAYSRVSSDDRRQAFTEEDAKRLGDCLDQFVNERIASQDFSTLLRLTNLKTQMMSIHRGQKAKAYCGAGLNYVSVSTRGEFFLCHRFTEDPEEKVGDLMDGLNMTKLGEILNHRQAKSEPCRSCWMREMCKGGCFHEHKMATGSITTIDPLFCTLQDRELQAALRIYIAVKNYDPSLLEK